MMRIRGGVPSSKPSKKKEEKKYGKINKILDIQWCWARIPVGLILPKNIK